MNDGWLNSEKLAQVSRLYRIHLAKPIPQQGIQIIQ